MAEKERPTRSGSQGLQPTQTARTVLFGPKPWMVLNACFESLFNCAILRGYYNSFFGATVLVPVPLSPFTDKSPLPPDRNSFRHTDPPDPGTPWSVLVSGHQNRRTGSGRCSTVGACW